MKFYYYDDKPGDPREAHNSGVSVSEDVLAKLGVVAFPNIGLDRVNQIAKDRGYINRDEINITPEGLGGQENYEAKLKIFFTEHLHEDEEIRYILDGEGYFDVRTLEDRWIRCQLDKNDLIILPAGIYHRFTLTSSDYIKAMRLFQNEPKWIPHNRPEADDNSYRAKYLAVIN
ncbi:acireductone dioxygenase [Trichomonascus vanleenenianus]|uniref:acireductone dioxygenase (Ni2+-requiring) n=1 Tax=Trichomonascus vanleenenianus TaxID=2268995 RepID=UPI003ECB474A